MRRLTVAAAGVLALAAAIATATAMWAAPVSVGDGPGAGVRLVGPATGGPFARPIAPAALPPTRDGPVPADLRPSPSAAARDYPTPYLDGCHVEQDGLGSPKASCLYGNLLSPTAIVLFGDSHALSWFPAALEVANSRGWRLQVLTMSACSPADIPSWNSNLGRVSAECAAWRERTLQLIEAERPAIVLVAGTRGFATVDSAGAIFAGAARTQAWRAGMKRTLDRLVAAAARVIVIADVPRATEDPPTCLAAHPTSVLACATPVSAAVDTAWRATEAGAAAASSTDFIDPTLWVCPSSPCPVVIGHILVFRNTGHLTTVFAATLGGRLTASIVSEIRPSLGVTTLE